MEYTVRHVLESYSIQGTLIGSTTTEEDWKDRWTEIYLYRVDPGGAPTVLHPRTRAEALPDGGYISHVVGQSLRAHTLEIRFTRCKGGVPREIRKLPDEYQPCPDCRPSFAFISPSVPEEDMAAETARVRRAREGITERVRMEVTRHHIHSAVSPEDMIAGLTEGIRATAPGEDVIRIAADNDAGIKAVLVRKGVLDVA